MGHEQWLIQCQQGSVDSRYDQRQTVSCDPSYQSLIGCDDLLYLIRSPLYLINTGSVLHIMIYMPCHNGWRECEWAIVAAKREISASAIQRNFDQNQRNSAQKAKGLLASSIHAVSCAIVHITRSTTTSVQYTLYITRHTLMSCDHVTNTQWNCGIYCAANGIVSFIAQYILHIQSMESCFSLYHPLVLNCADE